jgi:hypothetical protein
MQNSLSDINQFILDNIWECELTPETDIVYEIGCYGDDLDDFLKVYSNHFKVDMASYLWYFHTKQEGNIGLLGIFFKPPNKYVEHIPITPKLLLEFSNIGYWNVKYPDHKKSNYKLVTRIYNGFFILICILLIVLKCT